MLFCEICEIFRNTYFEEHLRTTFPVETPLLEVIEIWNWFTVISSLYNNYFEKKVNWQIYAKFQIIYLKVAFSQTFAEGGIFRPSFFAKTLKTVNFFRKSSILDVWLGSK